MKNCGINTAKQWRNRDMAIWHKIGHWWYRTLLNYKTKKIIENEHKRNAIIEGFKKAMEK